MLTKKNLRQRGWTAAAIGRFLGAADALKRRPASRSPVYLATKTAYWPLRQRRLPRLAPRQPRAIAAKPAGRCPPRRAAVKQIHGMPIPRCRPFRCR